MHYSHSTLRRSGTADVDSRTQQRDIFTMMLYST